MKKIADRLWQEVICALFRNKCVRCGATYGISAHHMIKRRHMHTRWALMNGVALCWVCHSKAEQYETEFLNWLKVNMRCHYSWYMNNKFPVSHRFPDWEIKDVCSAMRSALKQIK